MSHVNGLRHLHLLLLVGHHLLLLLHRLRLGLSDLHHGRLVSYQTNRQTNHVAKLVNHPVDIHLV
jgi:hypothetical protein